MKHLTILFITITIVLANPDQAQAYLDPGSGSYIFQLILGLFLTSAFTVKIYWKKLTSLFNKKDVSDDQNQTDL